MTLQEEQPQVAQTMRRLLAEASTQDQAGGRAALLGEAVRHLVPDEARILQLLAQSTDRAFALVHIHCLTSTGLATEPLLQNACHVGRMAGVSLPGLTGHYISRLVALGLVEVGPEDERLDSDYHALLAEPSVLAAMAQARVAKATPKVVRHTLVLSELGQGLWAEVSAPDAAGTTSSGAEQH